jgi:hypothetical protein
MSESILSEIRRLGTMSVGELHDRYVEVFDEAPRSRNRDYLRKRIAWRIQAIAAGGIPDRVKERARELARDADLRIVPPRTALGVAVPPVSSQAMEAQGARDPRLPSPGAVLERKFKGATYTVMVLADGFEYGGRVWKSLSAVAREITGTRWNGLAFFGIGDKREVG